MYFGCLGMYFGCLNLYFGCLGLFFDALTCIFGVWTCIFGCLDRNGKMSLQEFMRGCQAADFPVELKSSVQSVFDVMDDHHDHHHHHSGGKNITADEMSFLDAWKSPDYLWSGDVHLPVFCDDALVAAGPMLALSAWKNGMGAMNRHMAFIHGAHSKKGRIWLYMDVYCYICLFTP